VCQAGQVQSSASTSSSDEPDVASHGGTGPADAREPTQCWCCGRPFAEDHLVRLGAHPEVALCLQCSKFVSRRAKERADALSGDRSPGALARALVHSGRDVVVSHGWQRGRVSGPVLRFVGRFLP
jgi:hypothetical protein